VKAWFYIRLARLLWKISKPIYDLSDKVGGSKWTEWLQRPLDKTAEFFSAQSAKYLMKGYWMIDPDAEQDW